MIGNEKYFIRKWIKNDDKKKFLLWTVLERKNRNIEAYAFFLNIMLY